jgi:UDP-N-acetylglucosamine diphosphorylase/glucosamine-1-phosphate N-acetyltransferase
MRNIILFDDDNWEGLLPLTFTKPICELRVGILTIREKWEKRLSGKSSFITQDYLANKYPIHIEEDNFLINSTVLPTEALVDRILSLEPNEALLAGDELLVARLPKIEFDRLGNDQAINELIGKDISSNTEIFSQVLRPHDLFRLNGQELVRDFELITKGRTSQPIPDGNQIRGSENIFVEEGVQVDCSILNAKTGPIYLGKNASIQEGSIIRGPFSLGEGAIVKMGAKIFENTTVGPYSKAGGEIKNSILFKYSNKGHVGFLGNSVLGEWCNLGAGTTVSNLKNNYTETKLWNYATERFEKTGLQFCGLIMGDHSKAGISTSFNTATSVGVSCNIFGSGFPRTFLPSFAWGGPHGYNTYRHEKALDTARLVMQRRGKTLEEVDETILVHIYYFTANSRRWSKI